MCKRNYGIVTAVIIAVLVACQAFGQVDGESAFKVDIVGDGPAMFFIPGATCSGDVWESTVSHYKDSYTCHVFTLAGYAGIPPLNAAPMLPVIKDSLVQYIRQHQHGEVIVVGHSIGGWLATWIASEQADLIDKVIVVDALPFLPAANNPDATEDIMKVMMNPAIVVKQYESMDSVAFASMQLQIVKGMVKNEAMHEEVLQWSLTSDRKAMGYTISEMMSRDLREEMANITSEVLVLSAWEPSYQHSKEEQQVMYESQYSQLKGVKVVTTDNARHFIMLDQPDWMLNQIDQFLSAQP